PSPLTSFEARTPGRYLIPVRRPSVPPGRFPSNPLRGSHLRRCVRFANLRESREVCYLASRVSLTSSAGRCLTRGEASTASYLIGDPRLPLEVQRRPSRGIPGRALWARWAIRRSDGAVSTLTAEGGLAAISILARSITV